MVSKEKDFSQQMMEEYVTSKVKEKTQKSVWEEMQPWIVFIAWGLVILLAAFAYTDLLALSYPNDWQEKKAIIISALPVLVVLAIAVTLFFYGIIDYLQKLTNRQKSNVVLTRPEIQYPKLKRFALEQHGLWVGNPIETSRTPRYGLPSMTPVVLHFKCPVFARGVFTGFCWVDNLLFKDNNIFHMVSVKMFDRNTPDKTWDGQVKPKQPAIFKDVLDKDSMPSVITQEDLDEDSDVTE